MIFRGSQSDQSLGVRCAFGQSLVLGRKNGDPDTFDRFATGEGGHPGKHTLGMNLGRDHEIRHRDHRLIIMPTALLVLRLNIVQPERLLNPVLQIDYARANRIRPLLDRLDRGKQLLADPMRAMPRVSAQMGTQVIRVNLRGAKPQVLNGTGFELDLQVPLRTEYPMVLNKGHLGVTLGQNERKLGSRWQNLAIPGTEITLKRGHKVAVRPLERPVESDPLPV